MLNLKNTLDGYLKNVEVIGNTIQDTNNLADIRSVGDKVEGQELYNISIQVGNGDGVSEVVEILSPVQLEKVGNVADRIICKDGVWGVEKNIKTTDLNEYTFSIYSAPIEGTVCVYNKMSDIKPSTPVLCNALVYNLNIMTTYGNFIRERKDSNADYGVVIRMTNNILNGNNTVKGVTEWLGTNNVKLKYVTSQPQFISLPHDQQVKLRTFAGQTNIAFLTEIPGQIKAQVPKSLGAVVNTHTEQIEMLHNALKSVLAGDMYSLATILYPEDFVQNDNTEQDIMVIPE